MRFCLTQRGAGLFLSAFIGHVETVCGDPSDRRSSSHHVTLGDVPLEGDECILVAWAPLGPWAK